MLLKLYKFCSSIKLAVVLLVALAAILATATFYESLYDTKTAQHLVYSSKWFAVFLVVLWINIFCAAAIRFPWKGYQTGFVITHAGILILLVGSLLTMMFGVDGQMAIVEGEKSDRITLDRPVLLFGDTKRMEEIEAEFRWNPPSDEKKYRYPLPNGVTAVVDRYLHHAVAETRYEPQTGGDPAVKLHFDSSRIKMDQWLTPGMGAVNLGPAQVRLQVLDGEKIPEAPVEQGELHVLIDEQPFRIPVASVLNRPRQVGDYALEVVRYLPDAVVKNDALTSKSDEPRNPCVEVVMTNGAGSVERYYLFAAFPGLNTKFQQTGAPFPVQLLYSFEPPKQPAEHRLELYLTPRGQVLFEVDGKYGGELKPGVERATGWMDIRVGLEQVLPEARSVTEYRPFKKPKSQQQGPPPAIRVTLEGSPRPGPIWLQQGAVHEARGPKDEPFLIGYSLKTVPAGFEIELKDFEILYDPGTRNPASYRSKVVVEGKEHTIQMNEPLEREGYKVFQSSYQESPEGPWTSVFSVARDPGIFWKYLGSIMLCAGIFTMFYLKPYFAGRRKYLQGTE